MKAKKASRLKEPQEFWVDSNTAISVPMLSVTGTFKYKTDASETFSVIEVPVSKNALLVLLQPINGNDLDKVESKLPLQSVAWLQDLSPRYSLDTHVSSHRNQWEWVHSAALPAPCFPAGVGSCQGGCNN